MKIDEVEYMSKKKKVDKNKIIKKNKIKRNIRQEGLSKENIVKDKRKKAYTNYNISRIIV